MTHPGSREPSFLGPRATHAVLRKTVPNADRLQAFPALLQDRPRQQPVAQRGPTWWMENGLFFLPVTTCLPPPGSCTGSECPWLRALDLAGRQDLDMTLDQGPCPSLGRTWARVQATELRTPWAACAAPTCGYTQKQPGDLEPSHPCSHHWPQGLGCCSSFQRSHSTGRRCR